MRPSVTRPRSLLSRSDGEDITIEARQAKKRHSSLKADVDSSLMERRTASGVSRKRRSDPATEKNNNDVFLNLLTITLTIDSRWCKAQQNLSRVHCRVLPPGKFNGMKVS